jgi:hypothetical protein
LLAELVRAVLADLLALAFDLEHDDLVDLFFARRADGHDHLQNGWNA